MINKIRLIPLILLLTGCMMSRTHKMTRQLAGYWKLNNVIYEKVTPEMKNAVSQNVAEMIQGSYIEFTKGNRFNYRMDVYQGNGRWSFDRNGKGIIFDTLFLVPAARCELVRLKKDTLIMKAPSGDMQIGLEFIRDKKH